MKALKKLALVSAVSMISAGAFAMEAMDDESMAAATGQDGITIKVSLGTRTDVQLTTLGVSSTTFNQIDLANASGAATPDTLVKGLSIRQVNIHDDDGLGALGTATANSGAIVIGGNLKGVDLNGDLTVNALDTAYDSTVVFADNNSTDPIVITIDTVGDVDGSGVGEGAMLNVKIHTPKLAIKTGNIYVANSDAAPIGRDADGGVRTGAGSTVDIDGNTVTSGASAAKIANSMEIVLGAMDINIQLGNEAQTLFGTAEANDPLLGNVNPNVMVKVDARLIGGLTINNLQADDSFESPSFTAGSTGGGAFRASSLKIVNGTGANANDLDALVGVNIASDIGGDGVGGLVVTVGRLGETLTSGVNVAINDIILGSTTATADMGDVQLLGLNLNGTSLIISGH